jgi:peptidylprolyl isomerase
MFAVFGILVAAAVALYFVVKPFDDDDTVAATDGDTTTTIAGEETTTTSGEPVVDAGPCVEVADPLPEGAPAVPVKVGPPPTELVIEDLVVGDGEEIPAGATVTVDYIGVACSTGTIFDSSYERGEPATFGLDAVIAGWTEGIPGMKVGGQRLLGIPSSMGYGPAGSPPDIGPNETLWFVVEAVSFEPPATPTS